jgi:hypothetical protein
LIAEQIAQVDVRDAFGAPVAQLPVNRQGLAVVRARLLQQPHRLLGDSHVGE